MTFIGPKSLVSFFAVSVTLAFFLLAGTAVASQSGTTLESVTSSQPLRDGIEIHAGAATLRITALRDDIVRVRISTNATLPEDASWAVLPAACSKSVDVQSVQDAASVGFRTA